MKTSFDLIVIGAGAAGLQAAQFAVKMGARTALIEKDRIGGDCTWSGCVPSKTLLKVAKIAHSARTAADYGIQVGPPQINMNQVWSHVQQVIQEIYSQETPQALAEEGIEVIQGTARFLDPFTIEVG